MIRLLKNMRTLERLTLESGDTTARSLCVDCMDDIDQFVGECEASLTEADASDMRKLVESALMDLRMDR